jgi:hypothetical protein
MIFVAVLLAILPPMIINAPLGGLFYPDEDAVDFMRTYITQMKFCHMGGICALFLVNIGFFITNEKKGDAGITLKARIAGQNWSNFFTILLGTGVMLALGYDIIPNAMNGVNLPGSALFAALMPYYVFILSGVLFWILCMRTVPATNCALKSWISRKIDSSLTKAKSARN